MLYVRHAARSDWRAALGPEMLATIRANTADGLEALREEYRIAAEHQSEVTRWPHSRSSRPSASEIAP